MRRKSTSFIVWPIIFGVMCILLLFGTISIAKADSIAADGYEIVIQYTNANEEWINEENGHTLREVINSFDFGPDGKVYYTTYIKDFDEPSVYKALLGFKVYSYDGKMLEPIYSDPNAFGVSGGRVTTIGNKVYFNDGGTEDRRMFEYYSYNPKAKALVKILDSTDADAPSIWGLNTWDGTDFWASGRLDPQREQIIYYSSLDNGNLMPVTDLGIASYATGSGPVTLDEVGNLYLADGGYGDTHIWRFAAADVTAAMADPTTYPLSPTDALLFDTICERPCEGPRGASSMFADEILGLVLTATRFHDPSELRRYPINNSEANGGFSVMATSDGRMSEVRSDNFHIYFSDPDGIYKLYYPTVVIDACDSGVDNELVCDGMKISDLVASCASDAKSHGRFVRCVAHLTNHLKRDRIISDEEKCKIQRCAAIADIPDTHSNCVWPKTAPNPHMDLVPTSAPPKNNRK